MKIVRDIVVIGAASGVLSAIVKIASTWPSELPVAVLIALVTPDQPAENMLDIIESYAAVPVTVAVNDEPVQLRHIYVSPPGKHLSIGRFGVLCQDFRHRAPDSAACCRRNSNTRRRILFFVRR